MFIFNISNCFKGGNIMYLIVLNKCYGGYGLSEEAYKYLNLDWDNFGYKYEDDRTNVRLINVVLELGDKANELCSKLKIFKVYSYNLDCEIYDDHGYEYIRSVPIEELTESEIKKLKNDKFQIFCLQNEMLCSYNKIKRMSDSIKNIFN